MLAQSSTSGRQLARWVLRRLLGVYVSLLYGIPCLPCSNEGISVTLLIIPPLLLLLLCTGVHRHQWARVHRLGRHQRH